jgi:hypothetical protein
MGGACSTYRRYKKLIYNFSQSPKERNHLVNQEVDGKMKCSCILREQNMAWNGFNWD